MTKIRIEASKGYDIIIEKGSLKQVGALISEVKPACKMMLVSDDIVYPLYGGIVKASLEGCGYTVDEFIIKNGEKSKNTDNLIGLLERLADLGYTKSDLVIALGGGVVGDLSGFAASVYLRGVDYIQIPTTLLAAVDSSIGGKTAVNLNAGKNLAGSICQPLLVLCDCDVFKTLSNEVFADGAAEVIKYAVIADEGILDLIMSGRTEETVARCVSIKKGIVERDEFEKNERKLLNFGHTVGHAIERASNYTQPHGRAVAVGMVIAARAAAKMGVSQQDCTKKIIGALEHFSLPTSTPFDAGLLAEYAQKDKKRRGGNITLILPKKMGECLLYDVPANELENIFVLGSKT